MLLPLIAAGVGAAAVVFVDAVLPAERGPTAASAGIGEFVGRFPVGEPLPRWSTWWPEDLLAELLPGAVAREQLAADQPRLPRDFYDEPVPVPAAWQPAAVVYIKLSAAYDAQAQLADDRGWTVVDLPGGHLDPVARPDRMVGALLAAVKR